MQIFADRECTRYADGSVAPIYVRVNNPWGINGSWYVGSDQARGKRFNALGPDSEYPDDPYGMTVWIDWESKVKSTPYEVGEVIEILPKEGEQPVTDPTVIFTKP